MTPKIALLTLLTLVAFASNSILCRLALASDSIDAGLFTLVRIVSGAVALIILSYAHKRKSPVGSGNWISGALLFSYAAAFSYAYINLSAGTGGLLLFGTVQFTMIGVGIYRGERPSILEWLGLIAAQAGLVVLVFPGLHAPSAIGSALMIIAGISWGLYSLRGKTAKDSTLATADNFLRAMPFTLILGLVVFPQFHSSPSGIALAVVSGAITSGGGYVLWYSVLPHLSATRAAIAQLAVPAIVAILGVIVLAEQFNTRILLALILMLGGVGLAVLVKNRKPATAQSS